MENKEVEKIENEYEYSENEEDIFNNNNNEYIDYDEYDIPVNSYKTGIYKKSAIKETKGKGKFIKKTDLRDCLNTDYCKCGKCMMETKYSENFERAHSKSIFNYSRILRDYLKESKIYNYKDFKTFHIDSKKFDIRLIYKATDNKYSINKLVKNIKNNKSKDTIANLIIIKTSDDVYVAFLDSMSLFTLYSFLVFFTKDDIIYVRPFGIHMNFEIGDLGTEFDVSKIYCCFNIRNNKKNDDKEYFFSFRDSLREGIYNKNLIFKNKTIKKKTTFSVVELECFNIKYNI